MLLDLAGLTLVIPDKPDVERDAVADAWSAGGGEVVRLGRFWDPPALDARRVRLYGAEAFCQVLAQKLGLRLLSPDDALLLQLSQGVTKRSLHGSSLAAVEQIEFPKFVKTFIPKLIRSRVYTSVDDLLVEARGLEPSTDLLISDVVAFEAEVRTWILDAKVMSIAAYEGNPDLEEAGLLAAAVAREPGVPSACVIDVGLTRDRGWALVEINAAWGAGLNGCDPGAAARCIARATTAES